MEKITDDDLMNLYRDGDVDAFDVLFDRHYRSIYNYARSLLNDSHKASDVLQDTFLAVVSRVRDYEGRGHFKTWILRICRNSCFNILEASRIRKSVSIDNGFSFILSDEDEATPYEKLDSDDRLAFVREQISVLPERQREAITLYAFENMSYKEIAEVFDVPVNTVKTLIHRARSTIADAFKNHESQ